MNRVETSAEDAGAAGESMAGMPSEPAVSVVNRYRHDELFGDGFTAAADEGLGDHWSVPWSDVMMIMFVLFAALLTAKMMQPDVEIRYRAAPAPQVRDVETEKPVDQPVPSRQPSFEPLMRINVFDRSRDAVREMQLENVDIALLDDQSVRVSVQGPMFFDRGKAELAPEVRDFLDRLALVIAQTPYAIQVIGHTDDNPINTELFPSNWELSLVRASRVARHLIDAAGLDPSRFTVMGRGQYAPAHPNEDERMRALNRRVEIVITRDVTVGVERQQEGL